MIMIDQYNLPISDFELLLENSRINILNNFKTDKSEQYRRLSGVEFETLVCETMKILAKDTVFEGKIYQTGLQTFPDIIAQDKLGVEVKLTTKDGWTSTGNSILETTRKENVERVYMFFGKLGGVPDIKYKLYQDCLCEIVVTHSPRYLINMNLSQGESIFDRMQIGYDQFRGNNSITEAKKFYKKQLREGEELWWIDIEDPSPKSLIIKNFNSLDHAIKDQFVVESMIYFPEIFSSSGRDKFSRASTYLINRYNAVSSSLRDIFTAGGQETIDISETKVLVPKIYAELKHRASQINKTLDSVDQSLLKEYWKVEPTDDRENMWLNLVSEKAANLPNGISVRDIYKSGLSNQ